MKGPDTSTSRRTASHRQPERGPRAKGIAEHVDLLVAELSEDHVQVVADVDQVDRPVTERGAAVALEVHPDHRAFGRQSRQDRAEHVDLAESAVQEQQRLALTVDRVVVVEAMGRDVALLRRRRRGSSFHGRRSFSRCLYQDVERGSPFSTRASRDGGVGRQAIRMVWLRAERDSGSWGA